MPPRVSICSGNGQLLCASENCGSSARNNSSTLGFRPLIPAPCHRRLKALEESGAIRGYRAQLDPLALGLGFSALVFVTLRDGSQAGVAGLEAAVIEIPEVIEAQRLFGDPDYMLHVVAKDLPAFQKLYDEKLSAMPGVQRLTSTLVMKNVIQNRVLPL